MNWTMKFRIPKSKQIQAISNANCWFSKEQQETYLGTAPEAKLSILS